MSNAAAQLTQPPGVSLKGLQERKVLQAQLLGINAQLQNFAPLRDQLAASGQDSNTKYRQMQARRDRLMVELTKLAPAPTHTDVSGVSGRPVQDLPIAPTVFSPPKYRPSIGYTGKVAFGGPPQGIDAAIPEGTQQMSGSIARGQIFEKNVVAYVGNLKVASLSGAPEPDPSLNYIWMHSWNYLVLFPPPASRCLFTYNLGMMVTARVVSHVGHVNLSSFVSFGVTDAFAGEDLPTDTDSWPPFSVDLSQPYSVNGSSYTGTSGVLQGPSNTQGSFVVARNQTPAIAVAVGVISSQSNDSLLQLGAFPDCSFVYPGITNVNDGNITNGSVTFNYQPLAEVVTRH